MTQASRSVSSRSASDRALHGDCENRQCVVATDRRIRRPEVVAGQKCPQHERAKEARPSLLEHEHRKFEEYSAPAGQLRRFLEATPNGVEAAMALRVDVHLGRSVAAFAAVVERLLVNEEVGASPYAHCEWFRERGSRWPLRESRKSLKMPSAPSHGTAARCRWNAATSPAT